MNIEQKFKVYCSTNIQEQINKGLLESVVHEDEPLILEGLASNSNIDLEGDYMTPECLEDMKKQAVGLSIFLDHDHTINKIIGKVEEVLETSSDVFKIKFSVLPSYKQYIRDFLDNGINLGLSIGARVIDFEQTDTGWKIDKVKLHEISLVGIPANWDTFGTVQTSKELNEITAKCFNGACKQVIDKLNLSDKPFKKKELEDGEEPDDDNIITEEEVVKIFNELAIELKNQIVSEIVNEYNLDGKVYSNENPLKDDKPLENEDNEESDKRNKNSSNNDSEDKEKSLKMEKEEVIELIKENSLTEDVVKGLIMDALKEFDKSEVTEETPIEKEEELGVTKTKKEDEEETEDIGDEEMEEEEDKKDKKDKKDKSSEKSLENVEGFTEVKVSIEDLKKELTEELTPQIHKEIETEILKELSAERDPIAKEQAKIKEEELEKSLETTKKNVMSSREMAKHLLSY